MTITLLSWPLKPTIQPETLAPNSVILDFPFFTYLSPMPVPGTTAVDSLPADQLSADSCTFSALSCMDPFLLPPMRVKSSGPLA